MMVKYLGKKAMYELTRKFSVEVPSMRKCEYRFYRGSEWLKWVSSEECEDGWIEYKLYHCNSYYSLSKEQHLESEFKCITLEREVYSHDPSDRRLFQEVTVHG